MDEKPFIAWDGEGCQGENGIGPYSLFGASTGDYIRYYDLSTWDCLQLILEVERKNPDAIHVGFAFGYDINQIIKDLPEAQLAMLKIRGATRWRDIRIEWIPRKWFVVSHKGITAKIFDVWSFFNCGFGLALEKYEIGAKEHLERIKEMKGERPNFTWADIDEIQEYWELELQYLVQLMDKYRDIIYRAGYRITSWHGPGAIASYALKIHHTRLHMNRGIPDDINQAARSAYAGGRFNPFKAGYYEGPVYSADINTAYGYTFSRLPSLAHGKWNYSRDPDRSQTGEVRMGLYRIRFVDRYSSRAFPLFHRDPDGSISFPNATEGWFHASEAYLVRDSTKAEFVESWVFEDDGSYPFAWIADAYQERLEMQDRGDPTEEGHKRAIASTYGQVAQRAGWERKHEPPKWHQLEWAGAITSECRSIIYAAAASCGNGLISIDTDGVLSLSPIRHLPGGIGRGLGQWKTQEYTGILYVQSGIYWLRDSEGKWLPPKSRGIPRRKLAFDEIYPTIAAGKNIEVNQHMFIGLGLAMRGRMEDWRRWVDEPRVIEFGGSGKMQHSPAQCPMCKKGLGYGEVMHPLRLVPPKRIENSLHKLPWLTADAIEQSKLDELRKWGVFST